MKIGSFGAAVAALLLLGGCAGAQFRLPDIASADVDRAALTVAGDSSRLERFQRTDAQYRAMVFDVSQRLAAAAPAMCRYAEVDNCRFSVSFSSEDEVNAYATANNEIAVYRGLLELLETEDEFAAVIAHEIGHHLAQHIDETQTNATIGAIIGGVLAGGAMIALGYDSYYYQNQQLMEDSMNLGASIGALSYSKEQEREADLLAAYLLERAGYDLRAAGRVWEVLAKVNGRTSSGMLDSHPAGPERMVAWNLAIAEVEASKTKLPVTD
ncbi:MAG: M48 family metalloprotease [Dongiaceae bacterium]